MARDQKIPPITCSPKDYPLHFFELTNS
uniref:Uncharacterized protein n=1 Tax=Arundo donax TaxID=35708 RepID=A0A0A9AU18_ARUDO